MEWAVSRRVTSWPINLWFPVIGVFSAPFPTLSLHSAHRMTTTAFDRKQNRRVPRNQQFHTVSIRTCVK